MDEVTSFVIALDKRTAIMAGLFFAFGIYLLLELRKPYRSSGDE